MFARRESVITVGSGGGILDGEVSWELTEDIIFGGGPMVVGWFE